MTERRALPKNQAIASGFDTSQYSFLEEEGVFTATLDFKKWGKSRNLISYFTFEDGKKICAATWWEKNYLGLDLITTGTKMELHFQKSSSNKVYLKKVNKIVNKTDSILEKETSLSFCITCMKKFNGIPLRNSKQ